MSEAHQNKEIENQAKQAVHDLLVALNQMGLEDKVAQAAFAQLIDEHRTLQQNFWRCIASMAEMYSNEAPSDLRNEASKEATRHITQALKEHHFPFV